LLESYEFRDEMEMVEDTGVKARVEELRDCLNLAFDVVAVALESPEDEAATEKLTGSDRDNWYKNVRNDILSELIPIAFGEKDDPDGSEDPGLLLCAEVVSFLERTRHLADIDDWRELDGTPNYCTSLPEALTSPSIESFRKAYRELSNLIEEHRNRQDDDRLLPYLDPELADCIGRVAETERLHRASVGRELLLAGFARSHPGLVHLGGVPKGGTFVLVYTTTFDREGLIRELRRYITSLDIDITNLSDRELGDIARKFQFNVSLFERKEVVADFCLPYLCCGVGPIYLNSQPVVPPPPLEILAADMECWVANDNEPDPVVEVTVNEPGGELSFFLNSSLVGSPRQVTALNASYPLQGLTDADLAKGSLLFRARYVKAERSAEDFFTFTVRPMIQQAAINFRDVETDEAGVVYRVYELVTVTVPQASQREILLGTSPILVSDDNIFRLPEETVLATTFVTITVGFGNCLTSTERPLPEPTEEPFNDDVVVTPAAGSSFLAILNARRNLRRNKLEMLGASDAGLQDEEAFRRTFLYVSDTGSDSNPGRGLQPTLDALAQLGENQPDRTPAAHKMAEVMATSFLDKLAFVGKQEELTQTRRDLLDSLKAGLDALEVNRNTIFNEWNVSELYDGIDRTRLTNIGKQLRE
ncbi:MAG: hypothetical protein WA952_14975, partial [Lewinella sp.]